VPPPKKKKEEYHRPDRKIGKGGAEIEMEQRPKGVKQPASGTRDMQK